MRSSTTWPLDLRNPPRVVLEYKETAVELTRSGARKAGQGLRQWNLSLLLLLCLVGCFGNPVQPRSDDVTVTAIGAGSSGTRPNVKRQQLEAELMRYADRYAGRMALEAQQINEKATSAELRWFAAGWNLASQRAVLDISIGPNEVENLLDMLVFAALTRIEVESYWVPEYLGEDLGQGLLHSARLLEDDIWGLSGRVLTANQQNDLRTMIHAWNEANPDQHYFWGVRFSGFTGQRAADIAHLEQSGGLLAEVQMTREAAAEIQAFSERLLHYLQRAPAITRLEAEFAVTGILRNPEVAGLMSDATRISESSARYADIGEQFSVQSNAAMNTLFNLMSREREAAILQLYEGLAQERDAAIKQMYAGLLEERRAAIDQLGDIEREVVTQVLSSPEFLRALDSLSEEGGEIVNITFTRGVLLILIWALAYIFGKLFYDYIRWRLASSRSLKAL